MDRVILYEEVVSYVNKPEVLLVDVRNPEEIKETGNIPASINIPCEFILLFPRIYY